MARKTTRTRADQPQSNTVLIVFLVFSILLNLALGVFLYLAQDKIEQATKKESDAKSAQTGAENQRNAATKTFIPLLRSVIGDTVSGDDLNAIKDNLSKDSTALGADVIGWYTGKMWKELFGRGQNDNGLIGPFSETTGKPAISLMDKVRQLQEQLSKSMDKLRTAETNLSKAVADLADYKKKWNAENYARDLKTAQDAFEVDKNQKLKQKDEIINVQNTKITDTTNEVDKQMTEIKKNFEARNAAVKAEFDEKYKTIAEERKEEKERLQQNKITFLNFPKAHIVSYEPGTDLALIDLGSAVKLPLGLTFSIHGRDLNGIADPRPKAEGQVVRILGDQLAQIRITRMAKPDAERQPLPASDMTPEQETRYWDNYFTSEVRDFVRSNRPLYKGDYLFNVIWDPARRTRIALVGEFDLNGDGTDDIQALINVLNAQGADVDLYLDKANGFKPKGKLDFGTDLVILGDIPTLTAKGAIGQPTTSSRSSDVVREGLAVQKEALEKGIRIVQLPRFLSEIGLNAPHAMQGRSSLPSDVPPPAPEKKEDTKPGIEPGNKPGEPAKPSADPPKTGN